MDRRIFLRNVSCTIVESTVLSSLHGSSRRALQIPVKPASPSTTPTPATISDWMSAWMRHPRRSVSGRLVLSRFAEPIYYLEKPISWRPDDHGVRFRSFEVPRGFVTDLASIPSLFWTLLRPDGNYAYAAILHDYLYWTQIMPKADADDILKRAMSGFHVPQWKIQAIYDGVHFGGASSWRENHKLQAQGESRFLSQFPDDPTMTWQQWKQDKSHFAPHS